MIITKCSSKKKPRNVVMRVIKNHAMCAKQNSALPITSTCDERKVLKKIVGKTSKASNCKT